jgi:hypothetical protein
MTINLATKVPDKWLSYEHIGCIGCDTGEGWFTNTGWNGAEQNNVFVTPLRQCTI